MLFYIAHGCPNCGGLISDERLSKGLPCEKCLPEDVTYQDIESLLLHLKKNNSLEKLRTLLHVEEKVRIFRELFQEIIQSKPSSLQVNWAKRLFLGESFAILAPTGTGKTTFGLLACLLTHGKSMVIVPTKMLVTQVEQRLQTMLDRTTSTKIKAKRILSYQGHNKEKELLVEGKFDVFICTLNFLHRNFELLQNLDFSLIFIDDVDSLLKSGKNVDQLFKLLGFTDEEIALALKRDKEEEDFESLQKIRKKHEKKHKQLIVSSATLRPKTNRVLLFRNLLGFEITRFVSTLRKVEDTYILCEVPSDKKEALSYLLNEAAQLCLSLGQGGLVFVEESFGREGVEFAEAFLKEKGINCASYLSLKEEELLSALREGKVDVAVGLSHLSNPLLRGIDLPFALKYAIFVGVPKHLLPLSKEKDRLVLEESPSHLCNLLLNLMPLFETEEERIKALSYISYLKRYLTMKPEQLPQYEGLYQRVLQIKGFLEERLSNPAFISALNQREDVYLTVDEEGRPSLVVGNAQVYLQGSGRVSRLTAKGLLPGLSIILVDSPKALRSLEKRLRFYLGEEPRLKQITKEEAVSLLKRVEEERTSLETRELDFKNYLLIVESPHKAKTIANFFGKPSVRRLNTIVVYEIPLENTLLSVCASLGHVYNLVKRTGIFGVLPENGHFHPIFDSIKLDKETGDQLVDDEIEDKQDIFDKWEIIEDLRRLSYCVDGIFVASDPDAEGEKIAYDLFVSLRPFQSLIKRLEFHEVTPKALRAALSAPQEFNLNRVKAQLARRVADRWVGFTLSQELWKAFNKHTLSAGRVQTPVLGWVIKRAEEAKQNKYRLTFTIGETKFYHDFEEEALAKRVFEELKDGLTLKVEEFFEDEVSPPPPYTTDTILEDAFQLLRFSTSHTMSLLQELFELGLITYHRTDSTRISEVGRFQVAKPFISQNFGEDYFYPREWTSPGAHEGIRPTNPWDVAEIKLRVAHGLLSFKNARDSFRLYDLIFRRFMASQMKKARVRKAKLTFKVPSYEWQEEVVWEVLDSGFDRIWGKIQALKPLLGDVEGSILLREVAAELRAIPKTYLYNQGTLIQEMKRRGLGRPSTYAEIVSTLLARRYIYELKTGGLIPTPLGKKVYEYLVSRYPFYVSEEFTRSLEEFMDKVEEGQAKWDEICQSLIPLLKEAKVLPLSEGKQSNGPENGSKN
jgi:reverse gyrase